VGIPCAVLLADVPGFNVTGVQQRSERSGWKIEWPNSSQSPFEGDEPGLAALIERVVLEKKTFHVADDYLQGRPVLSGKEACQEQRTSGENT
jgi:hypothetical protein